MAITFTEIGRLNPDFDYRMISAFVRYIPITVPWVDTYQEPRLTSKVWFKEAICELHEHEIFVYCTDVDALVYELFIRACAVEDTTRHPRLTTTALAGPWY
jgi:hypothetical protein